LGFGEIVESVLTQQRIQLSVKGVTRRGRQVGDFNPHGRLAIALAFAH
jgi:hypothetical protein